MESISTSTNLKHVTVSVLEPTYPVNIGHMARLIKNFGASGLLLIDPHFDLNEALPYAAHAGNILKSAKKIAFKDIIRSFDLVVGTTAILGGSNNITRDVVSPEFAADRIVQSKGDVCLVFGRETTGFRAHELAECDMVITIQTGTEYRTLNIAHSAAVILYLISRLDGGSKRKEIPRKSRERVIQYALQLADKSTFPEYKKDRLGESIKQLLNRSHPTPREVYLLIGLLRKALLALDRK